MVFYPTPKETIVTVCRNINIANDYKDVRLFDSAQDQYWWFTQKRKFSFGDFSYQRRSDTGNRGRLRVPVNAEQLYDCQYIMFQNTYFGSKWFYAFITHVDYLNDGVSEIEYEIDVMQTYMFDWTLRNCFVVREHVNNDAIGANLMPENVELGDYVLNNYEVPDCLRLGNKICIVCTYDKDLEPATGNVASGFYNPVAYNLFDSVADAEQYITDITAAAKVDGIISVVMFPTGFIGETTGALVPQTYTRAKQYSSIDGYVPKNNKLFTYPYNCLYCTDGNGRNAFYRYEFFSTSDCEFELDCAQSPSPVVLMFPKRYKLDVEEGGEANNINEVFPLSGWPQCAYICDTYKAYLAQNAASLMVGGAMTIANGIASIVGGVASRDVMGVVNGIGGIAGWVAQQYDYSRQPNQARGGNSGDTRFGMGLCNYHFYDQTITAEYAKTIDNYFSMFGYAVHLVKTPNMTGRKAWNYVKTAGCDLVLNAPAEDVAKIKSIFDNGVTFWHNDNIGNYSQDNSIV